MQGVWNKEREYPLSLAGEPGLTSDIYMTGFVNAQYRFVMNPNGDYTVHFADPDMYISNLNIPISRLTNLFTQLLPMA